MRSPAHLRPPSAPARRGWARERHPENDGHGCRHQAPAGRGRRRLSWILAAGLAAALAAAPAHPRAAADDAPGHRPVEAVASERLRVTTGAGTGLLPLYLSRDWSKPQPGVARAVIVIHGLLRNADAYFAIGEAAAAEAGEARDAVIVIAPQFLAEIDVRAHGLPAETLRWTISGWEGGADALAPAPISSYAALDVILARLAASARFPHLRTVVLAGHSGGAQTVQRYAILGRGAAALAARGIALRYVVANPSSYTYFSSDRPDGTGGFAAFAGACSRFDRWKYGLSGLPRYAATIAAGALERAYMRRDVVYLLGTKDTDPNHPALDKSCMAEAQGPTRLARGLAYVRYLRERHPADFRQRLMLVPGVGHDGRGMLTSPCGLAALFDRPGCLPVEP
ncbi:MAG TPA: alpha/beta hydrolase [Alphaproteobacteria bacterium]|nr:alpha/beta hydrolase [Alphaproteobacteria bacterium]